jgi:hypothetical protein
MSPKFHTYRLPILVALIVCGLAIPRGCVNYGIEGDAIRGVIAANGIWTVGKYIPSRLPGNPLFEYVLSILTPIDGPCLINLMVLMSFGAAAWAFARLARERERSTFLVILFALTPILLKNAAVTKDYIPGLAALLWSYSFARAGQFRWSSLFLALAIGLRISNSLFALPLFMYSLLHKRGLPSAAIHSALAVIAGLSFYLPVFLQFGSSMLTMPHGGYYGFDYAVFTLYKLLMVFGLPATAIIILVCAFNAKEIFSGAASKIKERDPEILVELSTCVLFMALFAMHSDQSEYLIPFIPFFYLLIWRWAPYTQLVVVSVAIISFNFFSVETKGGASGRRNFAFKPAYGLLIGDLSARLEREELRANLNRIPVPDKAVVITGYGPVLGFENPSVTPADLTKACPGLNINGISEPGFTYKLKGREVFFVHGLSKENLLTLRNNGFDLFYFSESAPSHSMHSYGYNPADMGLKKITVEGDQAFYKVK